MFDLLLFPTLFGNQYGDSLEDIMYCLNEKVGNIRLALTFEIIELYEDKKYSYEEILQMIDNISFDIEDNLTENEKNYLKKDAKRVLDIRVSLKNKNKIKIKENDKYE